MATPERAAESPPPLPVKQNWPPPAVAYYFLLRARGMAQKKAVKATVQQYGVPSIYQTDASKMELTDVGAAYLAYQRSILKGNLSKLPYAQKWERLSSLANLVEALYDRFVDEDELGEKASVANLTKIAAEIRQLHTSIRVEIEGEGIDNAQILSAIEVIAKRRQQIAQASERAANLLGDPN